MARKSEIRKLVEAFELVLNEEDEAADELMHQYFVSLARRINEELEDEEIAEDSLDYDMEDDLTDEIRRDRDEIRSEEGVAEDGEEEFGDMDYDDESGEAEFDVDMGAEDDGLGGEADLGDLIVGVEDAFNELKSEFERLSGENLEGGEFDDEGGMEFDGEMDYEGEDDMDDMDDMDYEGGDMETEESMYEDDEEDLDEEDKDELDEDKDEELDEEDDEELDEKKDEDLDEDDDEDLDESIALSKVAAPSNSEGQEVGKGSSFATNSRSVNNQKGTGPLKTTDAKAVSSSGGEYKGHSRQTAKPYPGAGGSPKDMGAPDNMVKGKAKSAQKKTSGFPENNKTAKEVGTGKGGKGSGETQTKSLIGKKVR